MAKKTTTKKTNSKKTGKTGGTKKSATRTKKRAIVTAIGTSAQALLH
jgi:hypothetical protein